MSTIKISNPLIISINSKRNTIMHPLLFISKFYLSLNYHHILFPVDHRNNNGMIVIHLILSRNSSILLDKQL